MLVIAFSLSLKQKQLKSCFVVLVADEAIPPLLLLCIVSKRKYPRYEVLWRVTMEEADQHLLVLKAESLL